MKFKEIRVEVKIVIKFPKIIDRKEHRYRDMIPQEGLFGCIFLPPDPDNKIKFD